MNDKTPMNFRTLLNKKTIISFIVSFLILYLLIRNVDFNSVIVVSKNLNLPIYALAIVVHYSSFYVRGLRWKKLLNTLNIPVSTSVLTEMVFLSWFVNSIVPAKIGDVYRSDLLKKYNSAPISTSIGTIVVERVFDITILLVLLSVSGAILFKDKMPGHILQSLEIGYILLGFVILGLILLKIFKGHVIRIVPNRFTMIFENLHNGVYDSFSNLNTFVYVAILTIISWFLESGRFLLVATALGIDLNLPTIIFVALAASLLTAIPLTPAGLGAVEVSIVGILAMMGVDTAVGTSIALLDRLISYWSVLVIGAVVYLISDKT
ncbi:MAG: lysylphosphatidylglycerol synthase transmembrane domain-containing protein [Methanosarcinaceae archaeon]|nr:lysylphosphatidylglycerol synthase transmembrane domain-containing protein [Methanosarcinaceae archaeon]